MSSDRQFVAKLVLSLEGCGESPRGQPRGTQPVGTLRPTTTPLSLLIGWSDKHLIDIDMLGLGYSVRDCTGDIFAFEWCHRLKHPFFDLLFDLFVRDVLLQFSIDCPRFNDCRPDTLSRDFLPDSLGEGVDTELCRIVARTFFTGPSASR